MLRIVTWNVNSVNARLERLLDFLKREEPDVVCLQELKCRESGFPLGPLADLGYQSAVLGQKTYNGVAILSRIIGTPADVTTGFGDGASDDAARFIGATVKGVRIYSAYVPNGQAVGSEKYAYKLEWLKRLKTYLAAWHSPSEPLVVVGDFNVAPEDRDVHDPKAWEGQILCSAPERAALKSVCDFGLEDTFRKFHPEAGLYSWWDYRMLGFPKNRGLRIDFVLATKPLYEKCTAAAILRDERKGALPSDHAPVSATFTL